MTEIIKLEGEAAKALWKKGREAWNEWVAANPEADINFSDLEFTNNDAHSWIDTSNNEKYGFNFEGFSFPKGCINFSGVKFSDGDVSFQNAIFLDGPVSFQGASFGAGIIDFHKAKFGNGSVLFNNTCFNRGDIDFSEVSFGVGNLSFIDADFADGDVSFVASKFNDGLVDFQSVRFGAGDVIFDSAVFGNGHILFIDAEFDRGALRFPGVKFGTGDVNFSGASLLDGSVFFRDSTLEKGNMLFDNVNFGSGVLDFTNVQFSEGRVSFESAQLSGAGIFCRCNFGQCDVSFRRMIFGSGPCFFDMAIFNGNYINFEGVSFLGGECSFKSCHMGNAFASFREASFKDVDFSYLKMGEGRLRFAGAHFYGEEVLFEEVDIAGVADFDGLYVTPDCKRFSFKKAKLNGPFILSFQNDAPDHQWTEVAFVPDFTVVKTNHHFDLNTLFCRPLGVRTSNKSEKVDYGDAAKLCRLKELAEGNKHYDAALRFHADEMRVRRAHTKSWTKRTLDWLFDEACHYGQLIARPARCLIWVILGLWLLTLAASYSPVSTDSIFMALSLSLSKTIPFVGGLVTDGKNIAQTINLPAWYTPISVVFSLLSFVFVFLIGLGLRNRFRI